jgi:hypothetical protein
MVLDILGSEPWDRKKAKVETEGGSPIGMACSIARIHTSFLVLTSAFQLHILSSCVLSNLLQLYSPTELCAHELMDSVRIDEHKAPNWRQKIRLEKRREKVVCCGTLNPCLQSLH